MIYMLWLPINYMLLLLFLLYILIRSLLKFILEFLLFHHLLPLFLVFFFHFLSCTFSTSSPLPFHPSHYASPPPPLLHIDHLLLLFTLSIPRPFPHPSVPGIPRAKCFLLR